MRVVLSKGKWLLFAIVMLVLPLGVASSFGAQMTTLSIHAETMSQTELASSENIEDLSYIEGGTRQGGSQTKDRLSSGDRLATTSSRSATANQSSRDKDKVNLVGEPEGSPRYIYFDPQGAYGGSDSNDGLSSSNPVKTISKVKEIIEQKYSSGDDLSVIMRSTYAVPDGETIDFGYPAIKVTRDKDLAFTGNSYFSIGSGTATFKNMTFTYSDSTGEDKNFIVGASKSSGKLVLMDTVSFRNINMKTFYNDGSQFSRGLIGSFENIEIIGSSFQSIRSSSDILENINNLTLTNAYISDCRLNHVGMGVDHVTLNNCIIKGISANSVFYGGYSYIINGGTYGAEGAAIAQSGGAGYGGTLITLFDAGSSMVVNSGNFGYNTNGSMFLLYGNGSHITINGGEFHHNVNRYYRKDRTGVEPLAKNCVYGTVVGTSVRVYNDSGFFKHSVTVTGGYFHDNVNYDDGGVIACGGDLTVQGTAESPIKFENNTACNGGAIYYAPAKNLSDGWGSANIQYVNFIGNKAEKASGETRAETAIQNGGAFYSGYYQGINCITQINNCVFDGNSASQGGAVGGQNTLVNNSEFKNNSTTVFWGGAFQTTDAVTGIYRGLKFTNNTGPALYISDTGRVGVNLEDCEFTENNCSGGGAIINGYGNIIVKGSTFQKNKAKLLMRRSNTDYNLGDTTIFKNCSIIDNEFSALYENNDEVFNVKLIVYGGTIKDNYFSNGLARHSSTNSLEVTLTCGLTAEGELSTGDRLVISNNKSRHLVYATDRITFNLGYVSFAYNTSGISRVYDETTKSYTDKQLDIDSAGVMTVEGGNINFLAPIRISQNKGPRGGLLAVTSGEASLNGSSVENYIESYNTDALGKGAMFYVGGSGKLNVTGINLKDQALTGVGLFYVDKGGELNLGSTEKETLMYNSHGTTGLIYVLGTANLTNVRMVSCGTTTSSYGPIYVGGSGVANVTGISTTYTINGSTKYSNYGLYGGTITCGLVYDKDGNAVANTVAGGVANMKGGAISGDRRRETAYNPTTTKGGGAYVGDGATFNMLYDSKYGWAIIDGNSAQEGAQVYVGGGILNVYGDYRYDYENRQKVGESGAGIGCAYNASATTIGSGGTLNLLGGQIYLVYVYRDANFIANGGVLGNLYCNVGGKSQFNNLIFTGVFGFNYSRANIGGGNISLTNCYINMRNSYQFIYCFEIYQNATAYFKNCVIDNCTVASKDGETNSIFRQAYDVSTLVFDGCEIINNNYMVFYGANKNASLTLKDCEMYNNNGLEFVYFVDGSVNIANCNYYNNGAILMMTSVSGRKTKLSITDSEFKNNLPIRAQGVVCVQGNCDFNFSNCVFEDNGSRVCGAVEINVYSRVAIISDSEFINNTARYDKLYPNGTAFGGAIRVETGSLTLGGRVTIRGNKTVLTPDAFESHKSGSTTYPPREKTAPTGGGIFVGTSGKLVIKQGTLLVIKDNTRQILDASGNETASYQDNLYIEGSKNVLMGDLDRGSEVGINCASAGDELDAILSVGESYPVTNDLLSVFSVDNTSYGLRFVSISDGSNFKNGLIFYKKVRSDYWVIVNDNSVSYDPKTAQTVGSIVLMYGDSAYLGDYEVTYSADGVTYSSDAPTYRNIGTYAVQYKVEAYRDDGEIDTTLTGTTYIRILGTRIYIQTLPTAKLAYGALLRAARFYGGEVVNADGGLVAGSWAFSGDIARQVGENGKKYLATFTPSNTVNLENSNLTGNVEVVISYPIVFYSNGYFMTKLGDSSTYISGITDLKTMVEYMEDGSTLIFCETFNIVGNVVIDTGDKKVTFTRYIDFKSRGDTKPMIAINGTSATVKNQLTLRGKIFVDGMAPFSGIWNFTGGEANELVSNVKWYAVFEVGKSTSASETGGSLTLESGVVVRNWNLKIDAKNVGLITIHSGGTVKLDGCEIYANRILDKNQNSSVITNSGTLTIASGVFMNNVITSGASYEGNRGQFNDIFGKGGFLFCNAGSVTTISGGEIYSNRAKYGGAIYVLDATLNLLGGKIYANRGYTNGGAVYVSATDASKVSITIGDCEIYANMAGESASTLVFENLKADDGLTVFSADGRELTGASLLARLQEIEDANINNVDFDELDKETTDGSVGVTALMFSALCLAFVCIVVYRTNRRKMMSLRIK